MSGEAGGFHAKGSAYRGLQDYVAQSVPGGMNAVLLRLPERARTFFAQSFSGEGWYDVVPIEEVTRTAASVTQTPHELFCTRYADAMLKNDTSGVYRAILRFASPELLVRALPHTTSRYFDFVKSSVQHIDARSYRVRVSGIPKAMVQTYIHVTSVFIQHAIAGAGAKNLVAKVTPPRVLTTLYGQPVVEFERHLTWDN